MKHPGEQDNHQGEKMAMSLEGKDKNEEKDGHHTEERGNLQEDTTYRFVILKCYTLFITEHTGIIARHDSSFDTDLPD